MKTKRQIADEITAAARKAVEKIWAKSHLKGRCWGKGDGNPFKGTNITIANGDEMVSISEKDGSLVIHEFVRVKKTLLGVEVANALLEKGLPLS